MPKLRLVLFDGNALIHRAYHALPPLTLKKSGEMVNAAYGFSLMLLKVVNELKGDGYAVTFDRKAPTFRHQLFQGYKAQRPATPEDLSGQFERVRQIVRSFNIPIFEMDGYEADDLLGTLSKQASEQGVETIIVTGDADAMQLVSTEVKVLYPKPRKTFSDTMLYDEMAVLGKYGVRPEQVADLKALQGDPSDNIPGVPGIGEKTAVSLLQKFVSIEDIYKRINEVTPPKLQEKLQANETLVRRSKKLTTIVTNAPLKLDLGACSSATFQRPKVVDLFRELEFYSLLDKLPNSAAPSDQQLQMKVAAVSTDYHTVNTAGQLAELVSRLRQAASFTFHTVATSIDPMLARLVGVSFSVLPGEAYYVPVGHEVLEAGGQLPLEIVLDQIRPVLENNASQKLAHNGKYDLTVLAEVGAFVNNLCFDTMLAAYLLGEKNLALKALTLEKLGYEMTALTELIGSGSKQLPLSRVEINRVADYCCADADFIGQLASLFREELKKQGLWQLFADVEMPLVPVLMTMERNGILLDSSLLRQLSQRLGEQISNLEAAVYAVAGRQFNINSSQQLSAILYDELLLPKARKTTGGYSTDASVLEDLMKRIDTGAVTGPGSIKGRQIIQQLMEYRQLAKLKSTYIEALPALINPKTGRVHTSFNQTRTTTGRLSSSDPNLQNIPVRGELGRQIRQAFIAPAGCVLLAGDYSQIDLRALAHLSQDQDLVDSFRHDEDIHAATAAQLFGVGPAKVTSDMRRLAKTVNFGVIYGMSEYGLEQATELSRDDAGKFIDAYFAGRPGVKKYLESTKEQARLRGYVQTLLGRRRYIPEINSPNRILREAAERMAINMPVQGTSADIIKVAMVRLDKVMRQHQLRSKMLLQVHDELIFEVPESELDMMQQLTRDIMSKAVILDVPIKVDLKVGKNWGEME